MTTGYVLKVLRSLAPKEEMVIRLRFGIGTERAYTLDEIGRYLSVSRERVRQIELTALRKLKHPKRMSVLKVLNSP
jgi:RNA polymerase sigma factor (sigma-70 family)